MLIATGPLILPQFDSQEMTFEAILSDPSIDGIMLATNANTHKELATQAGTGKACLY